MGLEKYEGKHVRIVTNRNEIFEGYCNHNDKEYNESEYGINEEGLVLLNYLIIRKSDIKKVIDLEHYKGKYGHYSIPYSYLEEIIVEEGLESIKDIIENDEEYLIRILYCIEDKIKKKELNINKEELKKYLNETKNNTQLEQIKQIIERIEEIICQY